MRVPRNTNRIKWQEARLARLLSITISSKLEYVLGGGQLQNNCNELLEKIQKTHKNMLIKIERLYILQSRLGLLRIIAKYRPNMRACNMTHFHLAVYDLRNRGWVHPSLKG